MDNSLNWTGQQWYQFFEELNKDIATANTDETIMDYTDPEYVSEQIMNAWEDDVTNQNHNQLRIKAQKLANQICTIGQNKTLMNEDIATAQPQLTRGEKTALAAGKSLNTREQYALMYLIQTGKTPLLPQPFNKEDEQHLYYYASLNPETGRHTGKQIKAFIMDDIDSTHQLGNNQKGVTFIQQFQEMPIEQVAQIAAEALDSTNFDSNKNNYTDKKTSQVAARKEKAKQAAIKADLDSKFAKKTAGKVPATNFTPEQMQTLRSFGPGQETERKAYLQSIRTEAVKLNKAIKMLEAHTGKKVELDEWFGRSAYKTFIASLDNAIKKAEALRKFDATYQDDWKGTEKADVLAKIKQIWKIFGLTQAAGEGNNAAGDEVNRISAKPGRMAA